jgi:hypothetical protein
MIRLAIVANSTNSDDLLKGEVEELLSNVVYGRIRRRPEFLQFH